MTPAKKLDGVGVAKALLAHDGAVQDEQDGCVLCGNYKGSSPWDVRPEDHDDDCPFRLARIFVLDRRGGAEIVAEIKSYWG